jgi:hypothetical protein
LMLGIANAFGSVFYLTAVYTFFRTVLPRVANHAFLLFALGGGVGGIAFLISVLFGLTDSPDFQHYFFRFALYELLEGARMAPWLVSPRLYYTLPLACAYFAFTLLYRAMPNAKKSKVALALVLLFCGALINMRLGPFMAAIAFLLLYLDGRAEPSFRIRTAVGVTIAVGLALGCGWFMLQWNPVYAENAFAQIKRGMWPSAFITAACFQLVITPIAVRRGISALPFMSSALAFGAVGYLIAYAMLYAAYQVYYGSYWPPADYSASINISDPALFGAFVGMGVGITRARRLIPECETDEEILTRQWLSLWFLGFVATAISAFGHGWFLSLGPQRLMLFIGPPMALLAALSLGRIELRHPEFVRTWTSVTVGCGVVSMLVAVLCFQGPLGMVPGESPLFEYHGEVISKEDSELLEFMGEGVVMTPSSMPMFGDIVSLRGNSALHGLGVWDLSNESERVLSEVVDTFYNPESTEAIRRELSDTYSVAWVYCPNKVSVDEAVVHALRRYEWLEEVGAVGDGFVFKVSTPADAQATQ